MRRAAHLLAVAAVAGAAALAPAASGALPDCSVTGQANVKYWTPPSNGNPTWGTAGAWTPNGVPSTTDAVCITGTGTVSIGNATNATALSVTSSRNIAVTGSLTIGGTDRSELTGGVTLNTGSTLSVGTGGARLGGLAASGTATLSGAGDVTLDGTGTFVWSGGVWAAGGKVIVAPGRTLVMDTAQKSLNRSLDNRGTVQLTGGLLAMGPSTTFTNGTSTANALFELVGTQQVTLNGASPAPATIVNASGSTIARIAPAGNAGTSAIIQPALTNQGTLRVDAGTLDVTTLGNFSSGTLTGGTYRLTGTLRVPSAVVTTNAASISLESASASFLDGTTGAAQNALRSLVTNGPAGTLAASGGATLTTGAPLSNSGRITAGANGTISTVGDLTNTGVIDGTGTILATGTSPARRVVNQGIVRPGGQGTTGTLTVGGNGYLQTTVGTLEADVAGTANRDQLVVTGTATLGGTLAVTTEPALAPTVPQTYTILQSATRTGTFPTATGLIGTLGGRYTVVYPVGNGAVDLSFAPPSLTVSAPESLSLGSMSASGTASNSLTATVESTYRAGYGIGVSRTVFGPGIPLKATIGPAPAGAALAGPAVSGQPFAVPVGSTTVFGTRAGGAAPVETGLTPTGGDGWLVTLTGGPSGWVQGGTYSTMVTFTAVTVS